MIEFRPSEAKLQLTMRYRRQGDRKFSYSNTGFGVTLDQLTGLTASKHCHRRAPTCGFQLKRDAGTFNFEGWFKQGNGSGHFTFTQTARSAANSPTRALAAPTTNNSCRLR